MLKEKVNLVPVKDFVLRLPIGSELRDLLLLEKNEIEAEEFLVKIDTWLKLSRIEHGSNSSTPREGLRCGFFEKV